MKPLLFLLLAACQAGHAPVPEPTLAPAGAEGIMERRTLTFDPSEAAYDEVAGTVTLSPDSRRQSAEYTHYELDLASLEAALGGRPEQPVDLVVEIGAMHATRSVPDDPSMPAPDGGFVHTTYTGRVVGRAPAP